MWVVQSFTISGEYIFFRNCPKSEWIGQGFNEQQRWIGEYDNPNDPYTDNPELGRLSEDEIRYILPEIYEKISGLYATPVEFNIVINN